MEVFLKRACQSILRSRLRRRNRENLMRVLSKFRGRKRKMNKFRRLSDLTLNITLGSQMKETRAIVLLSMNN